MVKYRLHGDTIMATVTLPELPYAPDALVPVLSRETLDYHYGKHHRAYVDKLNTLLPGSPFDDGDLERIVRDAPAGPIFNNAAQIWNHSFYWHSLSPTGGGSPTGSLAEAIDKTFGSLGQFKTAFTDQGMGLFGSGWVWLVKETDGEIAIVATSNAANGRRPAS